MSETAEKTDPKLWDKTKDAITKGDKGGKPGQWSARKAQLATQEYKKAGGGYAGEKTADNHLTQWSDEKWDTKSGAHSGKTGERYLPETARDAVSDAQYERSTAKKRSDTAKGKQFSKQPKDVAKTAAAARKSAPRKSAPRKDGAGETKADLMAKAKTRKIVGRSKMSKAELEKAVHA